MHELHAVPGDAVSFPADKLRPSNLTDPARGGTSRIKLFDVVDLPVPLRPSRATTSFFSILSPTSNRIWLSP
jgi:hypothetical protein